MRSKSVRPVKFIPLAECADIATAELPSINLSLTKGKRVGVSFMAHFRTLNHTQRAKLARKVAKIHRGQEGK